MTVTTIEAPRTSGAKRVADAVRIQLVGWVALLGMPLGILALVFVLNLAIFAVVADSDPTASQGTGGLIALYSVVAVSHLQTMTQVFPFALGISVTRRAFYTATAVVVLAQAVLFGLVLTLLSVLETATGGWGVQMQFFRFGFLEQGNPLAQWAVYSVPFVALSAIFVCIGVVFKRWGQSGVYTVSVVTAVLAAGAALLATWLRLWPAVGSFFVTTPSFALFAGYPLLIAVVLGAVGFALIRRATP